MSRLTLVALCFGFGLAVIGVYLVALGDSGGTSIDGFGLLKLETGSVGIAAIGLGALVIMFVFRRAAVHFGEENARSKARQEMKQRFEIGVEDILATVASGRKKALEAISHSKLSKGSRERITAQVEDRITTLQSRIGKLERDAEQAIEAGNGVIVLDVQKSIAATASQSIHELGLFVQAQCQTPESEGFLSWTNAKIASGIAVGLGAIAVAIANALQPKKDDTVKLETSPLPEDQPPKAV